MSSILKLSTKVPPSHEVTFITLLEATSRRTERSGQITPIKLAQSDPDSEDKLASLAG